MAETAIYFEFDSERSALLARDTLEELGYKTGYHSELPRPTLHIQLDENDLTSALEITQAHGGRLLEHKQGLSDAEAYAMAYNEEDYVPIPAHIVNEDWMEDHDERARITASEMPDGGIPAERGDALDPSPREFDYIEAGIRL
ncbi:hypothetical protein [Paenibacillus xerothermodurans]|uniref:Uncharacterized protein n=1 Tax=Paenibacillus xerothermodurans TaxID=1977292 RepID=A0A2W1NPV8_PAEXE|nr:hypothetical protein [Paenibacillus xerothermodurans]PZE19756.1 hypothetical protein CBW46_016540 [Paenibacillus xerothermodurans]